MIRIGTIDDLDLVLKLAENFIKEAGYEDLSDEAKYTQIARVFLTSDPKDRIVILYEDKGMIAASVTENLFGVEKIVTELMWWVEPSERSQQIGSELLSAFEYWAQNVGAKFISLTCLDDRVGKFYEKNGYHLIQRTYLKEI